MTRVSRDSMIERGFNPVRIEEGRILNVNMQRWTADVRCRESQRTYLDIQWGNPYLHFAGGEGIYVMPEVGAKVKVCRPSESDPFILCFVTTFERPSRQTDDSGETPAVGTMPTDPTADDGGSDVTFRSGRPYMQQGDIMLRTRDRNSIWLRRGGVIEIASTAIAKRLYIPLLNYIRDICENYSMWTAGGALTWTVERSDTDPSDEARAVLTMTAKENAQDAAASVSVQIGKVDDDKRLRLVIAPSAIDMRTLEVTGTARYTLTIDDEGTIDSVTEKDHNHEVKGDLDWNVHGDATFNYRSSLSETVSGDHVVRTSGSHSMEAASSTERLSSGKVIEAASVDLGAQGGTPIVIASAALIGYLAGHTHNVVGAVTGPPTPTLTPTMIQSTRVKAV